MKELIRNVPEDAVEFVERIGGNVVDGDAKKEKKQKAAKQAADPKLSDIFGSWPNTDLDPKTYRKKLWGRRVDLS